MVPIWVYIVGRGGGGGSRRPENNVCWLALSNIWKGKGKAKGIRLIVLYPPKRSHNLPSLAGGAVI